MRLRTFLTACLLSSACAVGAWSCAKPATTFQVWPRAEELKVAPRPVPSPDILTSEAAANDFDKAIRLWGEDGWKRVNRLCWWARDNGFDIECLPREKEPSR